MELDITMACKVVAKTLKMHCKVRDGFSAQLVDDRGKIIAEQEDGYVPGFMPGKHFGDYVILDIDIDTGMVENWKTPTAADIQEWIENVNARKL